MKRFILLIVISVMVSFSCNAQQNPKALPAFPNQLNCTQAKKIHYIKGIKACGTLPSLCCFNAACSLASTSSSGACLCCYAALCATECAIIRYCASDKVISKEPEPSTTFSFKNT